MSHELNYEEISQSMFTRPVDLWETEEKYTLRPVNEKLLGTYFEKNIVRIVSKESMVNFRKAKYSVPTKYIGCEVEIETTSDDYQKEITDKRAIKLTRFPTMKTLAEFDFEFQPSTNKQEVLQFQSFNFLESYINICFLGNSDVGKTHLAKAIGIESCVQGIKTKFILFSDLIDKLTYVSQKGTLVRTLKMFASIPLLIIDEIGYTPIHKQQADCFYQLMSRIYEETTTVTTTNIPFSMWAKSFNNTTASAAILDRLIHHSKVLRSLGSLIV